MHYFAMLQVYPKINREYPIAMSNHIEKKMEEILINDLHYAVTHVSFSFINCYFVCFDN